MRNSILKSLCFTLRLLERLLNEDSVLRMHELQEELMGWLHVARINAKDPEGLLRPVNFTAPYIPPPASGVAELFSLGQVCLAQSQFIFGLLLFGDISNRSGKPLQISGIIFQRSKDEVRPVTRPILSNSADLILKPAFGHGAPHCLA